MVTELKDFYGRTTGPGIAFGTPRGLVFPYLFPDGPETGLLSVLRKQLFISLLTRLAYSPAQISYCPEQAYLTVFRYERPAGTVLLFANASTDEVDASHASCGRLPGRRDGIRDVRPSGHYLADDSFRLVRRDDAAGDSSRHEHGRAVAATLT